MTESPEIPVLDDPRAMRALAHPLRLDLLEALTIHGPLTATQAAELVGESPANCSWHLRQLAKYRFIEEADSDSGRERPWRRTSRGLSWTESDSDPARAAAARSLTQVFLDRELRLIQEAMAAPEPPGWADSVIATETMTWLTRDELRELDTALLELLGRYRDRVHDASLRPEGSRPVRLLALGTPDDRIRHEPGDHHD